MISLNLETPEEYRRRLADRAIEEITETLPPQVWCECGHISGHHGVTYPHPCATGGNKGCAKHCKAFKAEGYGL